MNDREKAFREKYKVQNEQMIREFIDREMQKIRVDQRLTNNEKRQILAAFTEAKEDLNNPENIMRRRNEEAWSK